MGDASTAGPEVDNAAGHGENLKDSSPSLSDQSQQPSAFLTRRSAAWTDTIPRTEHNFLFLNCDYGTTSLGPLPDWQSSLRFYASMVFADSRGAGVYWGPERVAFYNAAFAPLLGAMHPSLMGRGFNEVFPEVSATFEPIFQEVESTGKTVDVNEIHVFLERNGYLEEVFFVGQFIPLRDDCGQIRGCYNTVFEATQQILRRRRRKVVDRIGEIPKLTVGDTLDRFSEALGTDPEDIPAALLYSYDELAHESEESPNIFLQVAIGVRKDHPCAPSHARLETCQAGLVPLFRHVRHTGKPYALSTTDKRYKEILDGIDWHGFGERPREVVICPLIISGQVLGFSMLGTNPRRLYDESIEQSISDLTRQMEVKWLNAISSEQAERREQILERRLTVSEQRQRHLAASAPMGMAQIEPNGTFVWANDQFFEIMEMDPAKPNIDEFQRLLAPEAREEHRTTFEALMGGAPRAIREWRLDRRWSPPVRDDEDTEPSSAWILGVALPLMENGNAKLLMAYVTDISRQKWAEAVQTRNAAAATLAKKRQEDFIDVTSHEMRNPLSAISQLADSIATSLDTDLPDSLEAWQHAARESAAAASTILSCAAHQKRVIDDVLMLSRLDSRMVSINPVLGQPGKIVADTIKMFDGEVKMNDLQITAVKDDSESNLDRAWMLVDVSRLTQILLNFISNAIKYTASQAVREICVRYGQQKKRPNRMATAFGDLSMVPSKLCSPINEALPELRDNDEKLYLYFCIQDTGPGLTASATSKLFQRFSQVSPRTHVNYAGSGLGLYISRELAEKQGGGVGVASRPGEGSVFAFYIETRTAVASEQEPEDFALPAPRMVAQLGRRPAPTVQSASSEHTSTGAGLPNAQPGLPDAPSKATSERNGFNVIIVEDNLVNQKILAKQLRSAKCIVTVANHGKEALELLEKANCWRHNTVGDDDDANDIDSPLEQNASPKVDVILMDIEMPIMNGLDCTRRIRSLEKEQQISRRLPIIAVTANVREEQQQLTFDAGVDSFLSKPFTVTELLAKMREVVL